MVAQAATLVRMSVRLCLLIENMSESLEAPPERHWQRELSFEFGRCRMPITSFTSVDFLYGLNSIAKSIMVPISEGV